MSSRRARFTMGAFVLVFASLFGVALMEAVVRWKFPQPTGLSHQDRYGLAMHFPGIERYLPQFGHAVSFNSAGMRDREHAIEKRSEDFRVLLMGDSFMEAYQVPFDSSMPAILERELAARTGRSVEVINAGVSGWGTDDELRYYTEYGRAYKPDLVVVAMTLHNDISDNLRETWHVVREGRLVDQQLAPIPWFDYQILRLKAYIATHLQLYQLWRFVRHRGAIRETATALRSHVETLFDEPLSEGTAHGFRLTGLLLERLDSLVGSDGGRLAVVLLPLQMQLTDAGFSRVSASLLERGDSARLDRPQAIVREMTGRLAIPTVDLLPEFRGWYDAAGKSMYLQGDGHWNALGHHLASRIAAEHFVSTGLIR